MVSAWCGMPKSATSRPHGSTSMIDAVCSTRYEPSSSRLAEEVGGPHLPSELRKLVFASGYPEERGPEPRHVLCQVFHRIAPRIDRYQHVLAGRRDMLGQTALDLAKGGKRGRADVRAMGVAEEQEGPGAVQPFARKCTAVMVLQRERTDRPRVRPQHAGLLRGPRWGLEPRAAEPPPSGTQTEDGGQNQQGGATQPHAARRRRDLGAGGIDRFERQSRDSTGGPGA